MLLAVHFLHARQIPLRDGWPPIVVAAARAA
jgi:hypothetical protein